MHSPLSTKFQTKSIHKLDSFSFIISNSAIMHVFPLSFFFIVVSMKNIEEIAY